MLTTIGRIGVDGKDPCGGSETRGTAGEATHRLLQVSYLILLLYPHETKLFSGRTNATSEAENSRPSPQPGKEPGETSSVTEDDNSEDDSDSREASYKCSHCFATSKHLKVSLKIPF